MSEQGVIDVEQANDDDLRMWSVTTLIGVLDKPALLHWAANESSKAAVKHSAHVHAIAKVEGDEAAIKWLAGARNRQEGGGRSAMQLGTDVHEALELYAKTGHISQDDAEVLPFVQQFDQWAQVWQPEYVGSEVTVFSPTYRYAGTCDGYMKIDGVPVIFDYKTSRSEGKAYPEVALQLAAYRYAEMQATWRARRTEIFRRRYYLLGQEEIDRGAPVPEVQGGICIKISPKSCKAYPVKCDEEMFKSFLYVTEAARWSFISAKLAVGSELKQGEDVESRISVFEPSKRSKTSVAILPPTNV